MQLKRETITPFLAKKYLEKNEDNRNLRYAKVCEYANEMTAGRWHDTGDPIRFFEDGTLADGQHRLQAIIQSGTTHPMVVARGLEKTAMAGIDMGAKRSVADYMHLHHGIKNANLVCAAGKAIFSLSFMYQNYTVSPALMKVCLDTFGNDIDSVITMIGEFPVAKRGWIIGSMAFGLNACPHLTKFIQAVGDGAELKRGNPALALRSWLMTKSSIHLMKGYKAGAYECLFNVMNAAASGSQLTTVKSGATGINVFRLKQRKFIETIKEEIKRLRP